jgi:hypothetical protein
MGRPLWREDRSVFCICCWPLSAQSFSYPSPLGLATIFYCLRFETSLFVASYDSQGHGEGIPPRLHTEVKVKVKVSLGVEPQTFIAVWQLGSCFVGALSDERTGLSFVYAAGRCQRSISRVRVAWNSRPYFTVSDLRLPFSSPPTTRKVTVEVFDPASTRKVKVKVSLGVEPQTFITVWQLGSSFVGRPLWREDWSVFCICCWPLPAQYFLGPSPLRPATIFYCLRFETSLFVASYNS